MDVVGEDTGPGHASDDDEEEDEDEVKPLNGGGAAGGGGAFTGGPPPASSASSLFPPGFSAGRRTSVSAESLLPKSASATSPAGETIPQPALPTYPKSPQQLARIRLSISSNFLFRNLDDDQASDVLSAMKEVQVAEGEVVIKQGDVGDYFYVVEEGSLDIFKAKDGDAGLGDKVATTGPGMSFGELALMYKCVFPSFQSFPARPRPLTPPAIASVAPHPQRPSSGIHRRRRTLGPVGARPGDVPHNPAGPHVVQAKDVRNVPRIDPHPVWPRALRASQGAFLSLYPPPPKFSNPC